jgi:hypothetical protein
MMHHNVREWMAMFKRYYVWRKGIQKRRAEQYVIMEQFRRDMGIDQ